MINYFCLSEHYNGEHIGIVIASTTEELNEKIYEALESHFDCEILPFDGVDIEDIKTSYGLPVDFEIYLKDDPLPLEVSILKSYVY